MDLVVCSKSQFTRERKKTHSNSICPQKNPTNSPLALITQEAIQSIKSRFTGANRPTHCLRYLVRWGNEAKVTMETFLRTFIFSFSVRNSASLLIDFYSLSYVFGGKFISELLFFPPRHTRRFFRYKNKADFLGFFCPI